MACFPYMGSLLYTALYTAKSQGVHLLLPYLPVRQLCLQGGGSSGWMLLHTALYTAKGQGVHLLPPYLPVRQLWYRACLCVALCSPMDKAPDFWSGDCRFESCQVRVLSPPPQAVRLRLRWRRGCSWGAKPPQLITTEGKEKEIGEQDKECADNPFDRDPCKWEYGFQCQRRTWFQVRAPKPKDPRWENTNTLQ